MVPSFILFYTNGNIESFTTKISNVHFRRFDKPQIICCGIKHGLIYQYDMKLYQLHINNINLNKFKFDEIEIKNHTQIIYK